MLASGWAALERDDFATARAIARAALARKPADGEALYLLGCVSLFQNRFEEALGPLREAARPVQRRGVRHRLGYCYLALGEAAVAEVVLREEVLAFPDLVPAHNALGVALA